ncbi:cyanate lyase [Clavibacter michiganensis]|uniref:cyanase n=1 Tax=Clavibacter michiganensis TaxID=28447 RepID=UPI001AEAF4C4|nr:cyanase [Clavibacter michiganensis]MBP2457011.1 cyanate lyase [Clavibacter michiganensis]MDQ0409581.1 cyanate lyase [Clavibacter michiganensis]
MTAWNTRRDEATDAVRRAVSSSDLSWSDVAGQLDRPLLWTIAALLGSHALPPELAARAGELLGLDDETVAALTQQPYRVRGDELTADPTIYRFYELLAVYGPALKEAIHEEFGDGIMSAINCNVEVSRREDPEGDRVRVVIDGKFLKYQW